MIQKRTRKVLPFLFTFITALPACKKDELASTEVDRPISLTASDTFKATTVKLASTSTYYVENSFPKGYVKDGSKDYTAYVQSAIASHSDITFPAFPIMVNDAGLIVGSNKTLNFSTGSQIVLKATSSTNYNIFRITNATNVTLNNPVIIGDRYKHIGSSGEWGQGIGIYGSTNITISGANVTNCWGDGIYLAAKDKVPNKNIIINNAYCKSNRRNGISVTNAIGLTLESPYCGYSDGLAPFVGIDVEPASSSDEIQGVVINNARTEYNPGYGIQVIFKNLFGGPNKSVGVQLTNHIDKGSNVAFKTSATLTRQAGNETVTGNINIINPFWRKNTLTPIQSNLLVKTLKLNIINPTVQDVSGNQLRDAAVLSLFTYKTNINREANYKITF